jgi:hypothetical protein
MFKTKAIKDLEEKLYEKVASEIQLGEIEHGTWAKALANSNGDQKRAEAKYIQLRVSKLKEKSIKTFNKNKNEQFHKQKDVEAIDTVRSVAVKNSSRFAFFSIALLLGGLLSLLIAGITDPYGSADESGYFVLFLFVGITLVPLGLYTLYESYKIEKITEINVLYKKITRLFWIMIPTSIAVTLVGAVSVIIGLLAFIAFVKMSIDAFKFGSAYKRVVQNQLI